MKRSIKLSLLLLATMGTVVATSPAFAKAFRRWVTTQNLTGTKPSAACNLSEKPAGSGGGYGVTTGLNLAGISSYYVCVGPVTGGANLSGAGTLQAYFYDLDAAVWMREKVADLSIVAAGAADEPTCFNLSAFPTGPHSTGGYGCVYYVPSGVTVSAGTQVNVAATALPRHAPAVARPSFRGSVWRVRTRQPLRVVGGTR